MKKPKPNPKRPQLWFQPGLRGQMFMRSLLNGPRLRIIYPDGSAEWQICCPAYTEYSFDEWANKPCWLEDDPVSLEHSIRLAKKFDKENRLPPMEFVDNL